jgi:hypothetical protein
MQITRLLIAGDLDAKTAGLVLYALQTASGNLGRTRFEPLIHEVILDPAAVAETPLGAHAWDDSDFEEEDEEYETAEEAARRRGVTKAAEYLYELDRKSGTEPIFVPRADRAESKSNSTQPESKEKKPPARELDAAGVREQIRQQVIKAAPALLAANPSLLRGSPNQSK